MTDKQPSRIQKEIIDRGDKNLQRKRKRLERYVKKQELRRKKALQQAQQKDLEESANDPYIPPLVTKLIISNVLAWIMAVVVVGLKTKATEQLWLAPVALLLIPLLIGGMVVIRLMVLALSNYFWLWIKLIWAAWMVASIIALVLAFLY